MPIRIGVVIAVIALVILLATIYPETLESEDALMRLIYLGALLGAFLFLWGFSPRRNTRREEMDLGDPPPGDTRVIINNILIWIGIFAVLIVVFSNLDGLRRIGANTLSALSPGIAVEGENGEVILSRGRAGHFEVFVKLNRARGERMLVDTGASDIAIPYEMARRIGMDLNGLNFSQIVQTANGPAAVAPIRLEEVSIGPITLHNVRASVSERGSLEFGLLGMSFLGRLSEFSFRGDKLILRE